METEKKNKLVQDDISTQRTDKMWHTFRDDYEDNGERPYPYTSSGLNQGRVWEHNKGSRCCYSWMKLLHPQTPSGMAKGCKDYDRTEKGIRRN